MCALYVRNAVVRRFLGIVGLLQLFFWFYFLCSWFFNDKLRKFSDARRSGIFSFPSGFCTHSRINIIDHRRARNREQKKKESKKNDKVFEKTKPRPRLKHSSLRNRGQNNTAEQNYQPFFTEKFSCVIPTKCVCLLVALSLTRETIHLNSLSMRKWMGFGEVFKIQPKCMLS